MTSSMRHREQAIIAVWSCLPINRLRERKNNWCAHVHTVQNDDETNRIDIETIVETKR